MQRIPLIYATLEGTRLHAGPVTFSGERASTDDHVPVTTIPALKTRAERGKVLVWDVVGMNRGVFNAPFMEFCKVSGNDVWLIEPIYDEMDVLDGFVGNADRLVFPCDRIRNDSVLEDILEVSDSCVPLVVCRNGMHDGHDPAGIVSKVADVGFHNVMVADMDGSLDDAAWKRMHDECGGLLVYSPVRELGFEPSLQAVDVFGFTR
ncbi:MAG: hypothetical protein MJZ38_05385 [archaeon]|nr:hypothetical protein [archaeon]